MSCRTGFAPGRERRGVPQHYLKRHAPIPLERLRQINRMSRACSPAAPSEPSLPANRAGSQCPFVCLPQDFPLKLAFWPVPRFVPEQAGCRRIFHRGAPPVLALRAGRFLRRCAGSRGMRRMHYQRYGKGWRKCSWMSQFGLIRCNQCINHLRKANRSPNIPIFVRRPAIYTVSRLPAFDFDASSVKTAVIAEGRFCWRTQPGPPTVNVCKRRRPRASFS